MLLVEQPLPSPRDRLSKRRQYLAAPPTRRGDRCGTFAPVVGYDSDHPVYHIHVGNLSLIVPANFLATPEAACFVCGREPKLMASRRPRQDQRAVADGRNDEAAGGQIHHTSYFTGGAPFL